MKDKINEHFAMLIQKAVKARGNSYSPYSRFAAGSAILGTSGTIYSGTNVENCSFGLTICAERTALFKGISEGEKNFQALALVTDTKKPVAPCGACMQVLAEFNPRIMIVMATVNGKKEITPLDTLFPKPFCDCHLKK